MAHLKRLYFKPGDPGWWTTTYKGHVYEIEGNASTGYKIFRDGELRWPDTLNTLQTAQEIADGIAEHDEPKGRPGKRNPFDPQDPRLIEVSDLYMAGLNKQAKKKLRAIPKSSLSSTDQYDYDTLSLNLNRTFALVNPRKRKAVAKSKTKKKTVPTFKVGDEVTPTLAGLQWHARSVPASMGYERSVREWRKAISDRQGTVGTVVRVGRDEGMVPGRQNISVQFPDGGQIMIYAAMLKKQALVGNPRKKTKKKATKGKKRTTKKVTKRTVTTTTTVMQNPIVGPKAKKRILAKLDKGESLSTADFDSLGYPFELFLRYGQMKPVAQKKAHDALRKQLRNPRKNPKDKDGWYVEVTYPHSASTQKIHLANPDDWSMHAAGTSGYGRVGSEEGLYVFQFGAYGWTQVAAWGDSFQSAWDEAGDWLSEHAPGLLVENKEQQELMAEAAEEMGHKLKDLSWDTDNELLSKIDEKALVDLAPIGGHGDYVRSWEAHGERLDEGTPLYKKILVESVRAYLDDSMYDELDEGEAERYKKALAATRNPRRKGKGKRKNPPGTKTVKGVRSLVSSALK